MRRSQMVLLVGCRCCRAHPEHRSSLASAQEHAPSHPDIRTTEAFRLPSVRYPCASHGPLWDACEQRSTAVSLPDPPLERVDPTVLGSRVVRPSRWSGRLASRCSLAAAIDRYLERGTDLAHAPIGQAAEPLDQDSYSHALDGVQVDGATPGYRVLVGLQHDLAGQTTDRGRTRSDQCPSQAWDRGVARKNYHGTPADVGQLAPPHLTPQREVAHEAAAASRNDARSPHSSVSSRGCSS